MSHAGILNYMPAGQFSPLLCLVGTSNLYPTEHLIFPPTTCFPTVSLVTGNGNSILVALSALVPLLLWTLVLIGQQILTDPSLKHVQNLPPVNGNSNNFHCYCLRPSFHCLPPWGVTVVVRLPWAPTPCSQHSSQRELLKRKSEYVTLLLPTPKDSSHYLWLERKGWSHYSGL